MRPKIYHNPRCSKSRQTLQLLRDKGFEPDIVLYLESPLDKKGFRELLRKLEVSAEGIVRKKESLFAEKGYKDSPPNSEEAWIEMLVENPKLMERPIVEMGQKARMGRPPEQVLEIL